MCAAQSTIASLAISAGWMTNGPTPSQFVLPLTSTPRAVWVSASSTIETISPSQANRRSTECGSREATQAHGTPITTHISWRLTTAYESPSFSAKEYTLEALSTMIRPMVSSSAEAPSSR